MKVKMGKDTVTLKKLQKGKDHEGMDYIVHADIALNNKTIGSYREDYMAGPCIIDIDEQNDKLQSIAEAFLKKYPKGIIPSRMKDYTLSQLYAGDEIEALLTEMASIQHCYEPEIKKILKTYPIAVIAKEGENGVEKFWSVPNEDAMKHFDNMIVILKAEANKKNFDFEV